MQTLRGKQEQGSLSCRRETENGQLSYSQVPEEFILNLYDNLILALGVEREGESEALRLTRVEVVKGMQT